MTAFFVPPMKRVSKYVIVAIGTLATSYISKDNITNNGLSVLVTLESICWSQAAFQACVCRLCIELILG